jgi:hypothetical protein
VPIRSATRSADMPGPGKRFGHEVTMRQRNLPLCASAGAAIALASPSVAARVMLRRVTLVIAGTFRSTIPLRYVCMSYDKQSVHRGMELKRLR